MNFLKKPFRFLLTTVIAVSMTACGGNAGGADKAGEAKTEAGAPAQAAVTNGAEPKVLTVATQDPQVQLDMQLNTYNIIMTITDNVTESLLLTNAEGNLETVLLTKMPELSQDKLTYVFELKEGVKFHNGAALTSNDVKYSYERLIKKAKMASLLEKVVGYKEFADGAADNLAGFKVIDDTHFEITLAEIYTPFISALSTPYCAIYPAKECEEAGDDWGMSVLYGTGPFKLVSYNIGIGCEIEKNNEYHGTTANIDKVSFKFIADPNTQVLEYQKGTIDIVAALDSALYPTYANGELKNEMHSFQPAGGYYLVFNVNTISDPKIREAISLSIDRKSICESLLYGTALPSISFIPEGILGRDESAQPFEYNPEKAKQLLADAGYPNGYDLRLSVNNMFTVGIKVVTAIQAQAKAAGINVEIEQVDSAAWTDMKTNGKIDCAMGSWYADYNDPDGMLYPISDGRVDFISSFWHNPEFKQLMFDGVQIEDIAKRTEIYKKAEHIASREDFAIAPVFNESMFYLVKPYVQGFKLDSSFRTYYVGADIVK